jgi:hypothetical protein
MPMEKEEALQDFLKVFRVSLNYILLYSSQHTSFLKSIQELKIKTDALLNLLNPIEIGITPDSLIIDGTSYNKGLMYKELSKMFHGRKIKNIRIEKAVTTEELVILLEKISLPPKIILQSGGVSRILSQYPKAHFNVEDLDYSQLLKGEGEQVKDVWSYLLKNALETSNSQKLEQYAGNFESIIGNFSGKDMVEDEELRGSFHKLLMVIKNNDKGKYRKSVNAVIKKVVQEKRIMPADLDKFKMFFKDTGETELADILWEEIATDKNFDSYNFGIFANLVDKEKHRGIAAFLNKKIEGSGADPHIAEKIKSLFTLSQDKAFISEIYRNALTSSLREMYSQLGPKMSFDREQMAVNYRYILLNLLDIESDSVRLSVIIERFLSDWDDIAKAKNTEYLRHLWEVIEKRKKDKTPPVEQLKELDRALSQTIEGMLWSKDVPEDLEYFVGKLNSSFVGPLVYLSKIFSENIVNPWILKLFLRLFPEHLKNFYGNLENRRSDLEFISTIVESLKTVDAPETLEVLKYIFSVSNDLIKIEVLKAMSELHRYDKGFLFSLLKESNYFLKKEALQILILDPEGRKIAMDLLFVIPSPWGRNNGRLIENIVIADESNLRLSQPYIEALSKRPFFWNSALRKKAKQLLEKWND